MKVTKTRNWIKGYYLSGGFYGLVGGFIGGVLFVSLWNSPLIIITVVWISACTFILESIEEKEFRK